MFLFFILIIPQYLLYYFLMCNTRSRGCAVRYDDTTDDDVYQRCMFSCETLYVISEFYVFTHIYVKFIYYSVLYSSCEMTKDWMGVLFTVYLI